jgi:TonB family protein
MPSERAKAILQNVRKKFMARRSQGMKSLVCLLATLIAAAPTATAQETMPVEVSGIVLDVQTAGVDGAAITFEHTGSSQEFVVWTNSDGEYRASLRPGVYRVTVEALGFIRDIIPEVLLASGQRQRLNFRLDFPGTHDPDTVHELPPRATPGISVLKFVAPAYPAIARTARVQGDVRLLIEIARDGSATRVTTLSGHPMLSQAAIEAVRQWHFGCQRCDGRLQHIVTITFTIDDGLPGQCDASNQQPLRCVDPALPDRLTVRSTSPQVCIYTSRIEPIVLEPRWPSPIIFGGAGARPNPVRD